ncbi:unnamed protein product [marine sediment metagenome]|uniref:Uncharacterized protein n=1 Tax=marine sediment metagenome TaxID=412755 RepID=X0VVW5_9ZZZZ
MTDVAGFRKAFLAFWRGPYKALPLHTTSIIAPQKGGRPYSELTAKELNRLEAVSALGYVMAHNFRAYAVAWAYDFEGRSRHPEKWAKRFGISESTLHRLVNDFWTILYEHCHGLAPGEEK